MTNHLTGDDRLPGDPTPRFYQALLCPDIAKRYDFVRAQLSRISSGYIDDKTPRSWARMGR